ncbi:MAG: glycosyltransferase family 39 protein [Aquificaceae bacterium]|nr:glycosyltransferase family 39 protein [Aquificaceae bacterium]MDW8236885.1 glycosyltransferase family 39 protein [Aquificaceae bacterium]
MRALLIFLFGIYLFRISHIVFYPFDLTPEEAQYWDWSRHLDISYYSKPPMVAYLNAISSAIFGISELSVRLVPILLSFILSIASFIYLKRHIGEDRALKFVIVAQLSLGMSLNSMLATTDAPLLFFWTLGVFAINSAINQSSLWRWFLVGTLFGLAFLSKFSAVLWILCAALLILIRRRELIKSFGPYISVLTFGFFTLPVIFWNLKHDFVAFRHVSGLASKGSGIRFEGPIEFILSQTLMMSVLPFLLMVFGFIRLWKDKRFEVFIFFSLPVFIFFTVLSIFTNVEANWAGPALVGGLILASYFISGLALWAYVFLSLIILTAVYFSPVFDKLGLSEILPPNKDPAKVGIGWKSLGEAVSSLRVNKEAIVTPHYQIAAQLAFYVKSNPRTYCVNLGRRMNQYDLWEKNYQGDAIFVDNKPIQDIILKSSDGIDKSYVHCLSWRGEVIRCFYIYRLKNLRKIQEVKPERF